MIRLGVLALWLLALAPVATLAADCGTVTIGVDSSFADTTAFVYVCRGMSQGFQADDTLITSLTVWTPPRNYGDYEERMLFIGGVRSNGTYNPGEPLYGPDTLVRLVSDTLNPIPYRWDFDPPLALPRRGPFAFVVMGCEFCDYLLLASTGDRYPAGILCRTHPLPDCSSPSYATVCDSWYGQDLCFRMEFCHDFPIETRRSSWGKLKILYR